MEMYFCVVLLAEHFAHSKALLNFFHLCYKLNLILKNLSSEKNAAICLLWLSTHTQAFGFSPSLSLSDVLIGQGGNLSFLIKIV